MYLIIVNKKMLNYEFVPDDGSLAHQLIAIWLGIENVEWKALGYCNFCSKTVHFKVSLELPDSSIRALAFS